MRLSLTISTAVILFAGCATTDPAKIEAQIHRLVPLGTSLADAQRRMSRHGFECYYSTTNNFFNLTGSNFLDCDKEQSNLSVRLLIKDGKVVSYGPIKTE